MLRCAIVAILRNVSLINESSVMAIIKKILEISSSEIDLPKKTWEMRSADLKQNIFTSNM